MLLLPWVVTLQFQESTKVNIYCTIDSDSDPHNIPLPHAMPCASGPQGVLGRHGVDQSPTIITAKLGFRFPGGFHGDFKNEEVPPPPHDKNPS
jgi:hypothetical protein